MVSISGQLDAQLSQVSVTEFRQQLVAHGVVEKRRAIMRQSKLIKKLSYVRHGAPLSDENITLTNRNHRRRSISAWTTKIKQSLVAAASVSGRQIKRLGRRDHMGTASLYA